MSPEIVAELSANHAGSLFKALALVDAAAAAGAHAIKIQTWTPDTMVVANHSRCIVADGPWAGRNLAELYDEAYTPWEWIPRIFERARQLGMDAFSTPFDVRALAELEKHSCLRYKVASFELGDLSLIRSIAMTGKPIILSTGMATRDEIDRAMAAAFSAGADESRITLLKCTSGYPAPPEEANLATMDDMRARWNCKVGISDHTEGIAVALLAATLGADMIEKHLVLPGQNTLDTAFSITPTQLTNLCDAVRGAAIMLGTVSYGPTPSEASQYKLRRSLYFSRAMIPGQIIQHGDLVTARPALGLEPHLVPKLVGKQIVRQVLRGDPVTWLAIETDVTG